MGITARVVRSDKSQQHTYKNVLLDSKSSYSGVRVVHQLPISVLLVEKAAFMCNGVDFGSSI